jgi:hypothetical protein
MDNGLCDFYFSDKVCKIQTKIKLNVLYEKTLCF